VTQITPGRRLAYDWLPVAVPENTEFGTNAYLHSALAFRHYRSRRAPGLRVGTHTALYPSTTFDIGPDGFVSIGDYGVINGPIFATNREVHVGDYAYLSYEVFIADSFATVPSWCWSDSGARGGGGDIVIGDDCWIGVRSAVLGGAVLGRGVIVGAGTVVDFEVPDFAIVAGNPGRIVGWAHPGAARREADASFTPRLRPRADD
jgi:acetyltransferase-like isoleucine patch superfamily enzyme